MKQLTPERYDMMTAHIETQPKRSSLATESLWGPSAIARFMGTSSSFVCKLEKHDRSFPARRRGGRLYATKTEIVVWLSNSATK